jgi:hypothetical protein
MCAREVKVMLEIQRFRKYSVDRVDNVLVPVPGLEPGRREATDFEYFKCTNTVLKQ